MLYSLAYLQTGTPCHQGSTEKKEKQRNKKQTATKKVSATKREKETLNSIISDKSLLQLDLQGFLDLYHANLNSIPFKLKPMRLQTKFMCFLNYFVQKNCIYICYSERDPYIHFFSD